MSGETDLTKLIAEMSAILDPEPYVFATTTDPTGFAGVEAIMRFSEEDGETLILKVRDAADLELEVSEAHARITLNVHSALGAVGFLAAVCSALAQRGISTNAVAGFYHDHIFVPYPRAEEAIQILTHMSAPER